MNKTSNVVAFLSVMLLSVGVAAADTVGVTATGTVIFNQIGDAPLSKVEAGSSVEMSFVVDSDNFVEGVPGDTRGYAIDQSSFALKFQPSGVSLGLEDPFPAGQTPYFSLVEGFPVSDGFFVSTSPFSPGGVPLSQSPFQANLDLGYVGDTLDSLDILDAVGVYEFDGLTRFGFNLWSIFPDNVAMEMDFASLTIVPEPSSLALLLVSGIAMFWRRF
jgi:hypothetical protein